ncbi:MAG: gephyrin-like molybdotransferase Glp [Pyrinomonadaceae bacterium]
MIANSKAIKIVLRETRPLATEKIALTDAVGRVLTENIYADTDLPPFDRSQMDGYALKAKDSATAPVELRIVGESAAGRGWHQKMKTGEAVRIMTGAPVPDGADSIQKIELASESGTNVSIHEPTEAGKYITRKGAEIKKGARLFSAGRLVDVKMIASLAAFGYASVEVSAKARVSILGTGTEIVPIDKMPGRDQIRNSNSVMLKALCEQAGASAHILPQAGDEIGKLKARILKAVDKSSDILVMTGGVSVGKYDLTKVALQELGAELFFEKVRLRPGKPTVFGRLAGTLIFGLPGNPVSAAVTFYLFVRTAILRMQNASQTELTGGHAVLTSDAKAAKERDTYFPATLATDESGRLLATPLRWHGSSDFVGFARADALILVPRGETISSGAVARIAYL